MIVQLFAAAGFRWALRMRARADAPKLRAALVALGKPGIQLSNQTYRVADRYETETIRSEYERDSLRLRAKYARRCAEVGLVRCAQQLGINLAEHPELLAIAQREGLHDDGISKAKDENKH